MPPHDIQYVSWTIQAYEGIGILETIDAAEGIVVIHTTGSMAPAVMELMQQFGAELGGEKNNIQRIP